MAKKLNKSGKRLVKKKGSDGRVRAYWTGRKQEAKSLKSQGPEGEKPGFLRRHGGKLLAGAALLGVAAMNRHKIAGAVGGARLGHAMSKSGGGGLAERAHAAFSGAKAGYMTHKGMDRADGIMGRMAFRGAGAVDQAHGMLGKARGALADRANQYRTGHGGALAGHMSNVLGGMALSHLGAKFGQTAGTALGSMAGPGGAAVGGMLGGHVGEWLANRHGAGHVQRAAQHIQERVQGNHVPNQAAVPINFGASSRPAPHAGPHAAMTPAAHRPAAPAPSATPHQAASHMAHTAPASQSRSFAQPVVGAGPMAHTAAPAQHLQSSRAAQQHMANATRDRERAEKAAHKERADTERARERAHRQMTGKRWWQR